MVFFGNINCSRYKPILDEALQIAGMPKLPIIVKQRKESVANLIPGQDKDWDELLAGDQRHDCVDIDSMDPLYILYTSGTTGEHSFSMNTLES